MNSLRDTDFDDPGTSIACAIMKPLADVNVTVVDLDLLISHPTGRLTVYECFSLVYVVRFAGSITRLPLLAVVSVLDGVAVAIGVEVGVLVAVGVGVGVLVAVGVEVGVEVSVGVGVGVGVSAAVCPASVMVCIAVVVVSVLSPPDPNSPAHPVRSGIHPAIPVRRCRLFICLIVGVVS
jgi:hypothetical protein